MSFSDKLAKRKAQMIDEREDAEDTEMNPVTLQLLGTLAGVNGTIKPRKGNTIQVPENAIVPTDDGALEYRSFRLTRVGLQPASGGSLDDWMQVGMFLRQVEGSLQWLIGDWINRGESIYGQTYEQIALMMGFETRTLYDYAYVARQVDFSIRIENLSFGHHQVVVALDSDQQRYWLEQASAGQWSIAKLRKAIKGEDDTDSVKRDPFASFVASQMRDAKRLDRPALATRVNQLEDLLDQLRQELNRKPR